MKEIRHIVTAYGQIDFTKNKAALATLVRVEGSSYRRTGARMLVLDNGTYLGGISGGCLEGDALRRAQKAIAANKASVVTYDTTRDDHNQIGVGLGCDGIVDVLFTPLQPSDPANPVQLLRERSDTRQPRLLATITHCDTDPELLGKTIPLDDPAQWQNDFPLPALTEIVLTDALNALKKGETQTLCYPNGPSDEVRICLEVLMPNLQIILYGANNDIYSLARISKELGWGISVIANPLKVDKSLLAMGARVLPPEAGMQATIDAYTAVVLMAHDYKTDFQNFQNVLHSEARYIGLLGPRKRAEKMFVALDAAGKPVGEAELARIFAPAGLDIGALSPEEIALSIAAEIRAHFAGRKGASLRFRATAIHDQAFVED